MTSPPSLSFRGLPGICLVVGGLATLLATLDAYRSHELEAQAQLDRATVRHWEALELLIEKHEMALAGLSDVVAAVPPEDERAMLEAWTAKVRRLVLPQNFPGWIELGIARSHAGPIPARTEEALFQGANRSRLDFKVLGHLRTVPMKSLVGTSIARNQRFGAVQQAVVDNRARIRKPFWAVADPAEESDWRLLGGRGSSVPADKLTNAVINLRMFLAPHRGQYVEEAGTNRPIVIVFGALVVDHLGVLVSEGLGDGLMFRVHDRIPAGIVPASDLTNSVPIRRGLASTKPGLIEFAVTGGANWLPNGPARLNAEPDGSGRISRLVRRQYTHEWLIEARPTASFPQGGSWMRVVVTGALGSVLSLGSATTLAIEGRRRRQAEALLIQLGRADADLRQSTAERQRIVQDLHDEAAQTLTGLSMLLRRTVRDLDDSGWVGSRSEAQMGTRESLGLAIEGLDEVSSELRQHMLSMEAFPRGSADWWNSLGRWLDRFRRATDCRIEMAMEDSLRSELGLEDRVLLEAAIRELTSNSIRHGRASLIRIRLRREDGLWTFDLEDDGVGFDPGLSRIGHGISGLQDRMKAAGGVVQVRSNPGEGARTTLQWPFRRGGAPERSTI